MNPKLTESSEEKVSETPRWVRIIRAAVVAIIMIAIGASLGFC